MYGKIHQSLYTGSLLGSGPEIFSVWGWIIAHVHDGIVEVNPTLLSMVIGKITPEEVCETLKFLASPDPRTRTPDEDGRRIIPLSDVEIIPGRAIAYRVVNHAMYRDFKTPQSRRDYMRDYMRRKRQRGTDVNLRKTGKPKVRQAEAEAKTYTEEEKTPLPPASGGVACHGSDGIFELPEDLRELADCWRRWLDYRKELRKPVKPRSAAQAFADFRRWGVTASRTAIDASIRNGWQGLFEPKIGGNGSAVVDHAGERVANAEKRRNDQLARVNAMLQEDQ